MNPTVTVRRRQEPPLTAIWHKATKETDLEKVPPDLLMTRIWIGVAPPEGKFPGYACVVGEVFDNEPAQSIRKRIVLDDAMCLVPDQFTAARRKQLQLPDTMPKVPTLHQLRQAVIGLKNLWWPNLIYVPPDNVAFFQYFRSTDGLFSYDERYGEGQYRMWHPYHVNKSYLTDAVVRAGRIDPQTEQYREDQDFNVGLVNSLLGMDRLTVAEDLLWWEHNNTRPSVNRALGMVLNEMEYHDMTYAVRDYRISDGYDHEPDEERVMEAQADMDEQVQNLLYVFGNEGQWLDRESDKRWEAA